MRRRPAALALQAALLTVLVGGTTAFVALDKTVTISVDGEEREVRSFADTVGDVLAKEGIELGPHDVVAPSPDSALQDGQDVSVRYGRLLTLEVDGQERDVWVTADSVDEALDQLGLRANGAFVSVSRSQRIGRDGLELELRTPKTVTLVADGASKRVTTTAPTVAGALREAGLTVSRTDKVSVALDAAPADGQTVRVTRIVKRHDTGTEAVAFDTVRTETDDLYTGEERISRAGRDGVRTITYRETLVEGKLVTRRVNTERVTTAPVDEIVQVGTKERPASEPSRSSSSSSSPSSSSSSSDDDGGSESVPSSGGLNWAALAQCESGGNPSIVSSNGLYYGLYQFSIATWQSVGGSGLPSEASVSEQTRRAQILYDTAGRGQWPHCGRYL